MNVLGAELRGHSEFGEGLPGQHRRHNPVVDDVPQRVVEQRWIVRGDDHIVGARVRPLTAPFWLVELVEERERKRERLAGLRMLPLERLNLAPLGVPPPPPLQRQPWKVGLPSLEHGVRFAKPIGVCVTHRADKVRLT